MFTKSQKSISYFDEKSIIPKKEIEMIEDTVHLILTRFNLAIRFGCNRRFDSNVPAEKPWLDADYLKKRFEIFEKYTFPSFQSQTEKEFKWIVMFHSDTPESFKKRIKELKLRMEQFCPIFLDDEECEKMAVILQEYICKNYNGKRIITTRVDNDDAVHLTFVENIQRDIVENVKQSNTVLTYVNGLQYDIRNKRALKYEYANNHFLSLYVSDVKANNHILFYNHDDISKIVQNNQMQIVKKNTKIPLWVEVITENNFSNTPRWRFSSVMIPYETEKDYPLLLFKWNTKAGWLLHWCTGICQVFFQRGKGLFRMIFSR